MIDRAILLDVATRLHLSPRLLEAQMYVESDGQPDAFRYEPLYYAHYIVGNPTAAAAKYGPLAACSFGALQILLETACELGFSGQPWDLFDPATGLEWGGRYLAQLLQRCHGDYAMALAQYNGGAVGNTKPPLRNQPYADKVLAMEAELPA